MLEIVGQHWVIEKLWKQLLQQKSWKGQKQSNNKIRSGDTERSHNKTKGGKDILRADADCVRRLLKAESFSDASFFNTLSSKVLERFSPFLCFSTKKSVSNGQFCQSCGLKAITDLVACTSNKKPNRTYEDKVLKN